MERRLENKAQQDNISATQVSSPQQTLLLETRYSDNRNCKIIRSASFHFQSIHNDMLLVGKFCVLTWKTKLRVNFAVTFYFANVKLAKLDEPRNTIVQRSGFNNSHYERSKRYE